jgi:hypothetical protein
MVRRYRRYFGVDLVAAALELRVLGVKVSEERVAELKRLAETPKKSAKEKATREMEMLQRELDRCWPVWRDEPFPFPVDES